MDGESRIFHTSASKNLFETNETIALCCARSEQREAFETPTRQNDTGNAKK